MRKSAQIVLVAVIVLLAGATTMLFMQNKKASADYADLKATEETTSNRYAQTIDAIAEIQDSLSAISVGEGGLQVQGGSLQTERSLSGRPNNQEALDRIAAVRASIARSKARINQLEASLKKSGNKVAGLQKMVASLKASVEEKEQMVAELSTRVDTLTTQVAGLTTTVQENQQTIQENQQTIEDKRKEIATIFYAVGTKKSLTQSGIVEAKGGVLGVGKTLKPTGQFNEMEFVALDTDQQTVVPISAAKAQVISAQPPSSYQLVPVEGKLELHIIDPKEFRKVKQLVIVTA